MRSLSSIRFSMHRATNMLFYAVLIGIGILIGFTLRSLNFSEIITNISKYLFIL